MAAAGWFAACRLPRNLLWVDCLAAFAAGVLALLLGPWLAEWYQLPMGLMQFIGVANLLYGSYSFCLATRPDARALRWVVLLVIANFAWSLTCLGMSLWMWSQITAFGLAHLVFEALFVAQLARLEWRHRNEIAHAKSL